MDIKNQVQKLDALVAKGDMITAINSYFCDMVSTSDFGGVTTSGKQQMIEKTEGFLGSIAKVNSIQHHQTLVDGLASSSAFTLDFDMKDGSKILWNEIISRQWDNKGKVTHEEYFKSN